MVSDVKYAYAGSIESIFGPKDSTNSLLIKSPVGCWIVRPLGAVISTEDMVSLFPVRCYYSWYMAGLKYKRPLDATESHTCHSINGSISGSRFRIWLGQEIEETIMQKIDSIEECNVRKAVPFRKI